MHLTGKKDVGSATSNCNDAASINNVVNEETQDEQSLPPQSEVNRYWNRWSCRMILLRWWYYLVECIWNDDKIEWESNCEPLEHQVEPDQFESVMKYLVKWEQLDNDRCTMSCSTVMTVMLHDKLHVTYDNLVFPMVIWILSADSSRICIRFNSQL